jgi:hypothetical protein
MAKVMKTKRRGVGMLAACIGLSLLAGCQTWVPEAGLTLPSGHYLRHPPQYFPPSPAFPLQRELTSLEEAAQQAYKTPAPLVPVNPR